MAELTEGTLSKLTGKLIVGIHQKGSLSWIVGALTVVVTPGMLKGRLSYRLFQLIASPLSGSCRTKGEISRGPFKYSRTVSREI